MLAPCFRLSIWRLARKDNAAPVIGYDINGMDSNTAVNQF